MLEIFAVHQEERLDTRSHAALLALVPDEKRERLAKFWNWQDAQRGLISEALIRSVIRRRLGSENRDIVFERNPFGKPSLMGHPDVHFNLSDSGTWVVCALCDRPVGIDIEAIKPIDFSVSRDFFSAEEHRALMALPESQRLGFFYDLWTLKESYIKAVGKGLFLELSAFSIHISSNGRISVAGVDDAEAYHFRQYDIDRGYKLSVCVAGEIGEDKLIVHSLDEMLRKLAFQIDLPSGKSHSES